MTNILLPTATQSLQLQHKILHSYSWTGSH